MIKLNTHDFVTCADNAINVSVPSWIGMDFADTSGNSSGEWIKTFRSLRNLNLEKENNYDTNYYS